MEQEGNRGERQSLYRNREEIVKAKEAKGGMSAATWFLSGSKRSVISCQVTPGGKLAKMLKDKIGKTTNGDTRLVTEEGGIPVTMGLKATDPYRKEVCQYGDNECWIEKGKCSEMGALYVITCVTCNDAIDTTERDNPRLPGDVQTPNYIGMTVSSLNA